MILLKRLAWSSFFSYGLDNVIHFDRDPIVQLIGKNGHGKSSIALILEEILFNKNSKGIKKSDILNRHTKEKVYSGELEFDKDGTNYIIQTSRGTTQTVTLLKDGVNISGHTATSTFKIIEEVLGFDHKTFTQLVYQSSSASLEFLTATDTNRKKFLIDLLNLSKYVTAFEHFKDLSKELSTELLVLEGKVKTTQAWLDKSAKEDLNAVELKETPTIDKDIHPIFYELGNKLKSIDTTNRKIRQNNQYKAELDSLDLTLIGTSVPVKSDKEFIGQLATHKQVIKAADTLINKINKLEGVCPTCLQEVNKVKLTELVKEQVVIKLDAENAIKDLDSRIEEVALNNKKAAEVAKIKNEYESYHSLIDNTLPEELLDGEAINTRLKELSANISAYEKQLEEVEKHNMKASAHNSKVTVILSQMDSMRTEVLTYNMEVAALSGKLNLLQILQKTFSTNGLIAYKIECLVKDLEILANEYLTEMSAGRFQLAFKVSSTDKLNVVITDNGKDIDILALSGGERSRVNVSTLLAIRKLMQSLSSVRINLLILDETIDNLDVEGKEKLVEILLKEEHLNTFIVSHGYTHPLLEKITVIKENNISRLE